MHFASEDVPYALLPSRSEMTITDEDVWNFSDAHRQALTGKYCIITVAHLLGDSLTAPIGAPI